VADLLECLIQIKGLADTPRRLAQRTAEAVSASPTPEEAVHRACEVACRLLLAEREFRGSLSRVLAHDRPMLPALDTLDTIDTAGISPDPIGGCERAFAAERAETVRLLEACSADQLNRIGIEPSRGPMTIADLVAVMLAHDTDRLGELVTR
jgi:hypothetical protein